MSNNFGAPEARNPPYYVAQYEGRTVAIKRDSDYQTTIKLLQKSIPKLRSVEPENIFMSTKFADLDDLLVQISEEIWPSIVVDVKVVEVTLEDSEDVDNLTLVSPEEARNKSIIGLGNAPSMRHNEMTDPGSVFESRLTLAQSSIGPFDTPVDPCGPITVLVQTPSQTLLDFHGLRPSSTVGDIKVLLQEDYNIPVALQSLELSGRRLPNTTTFQESGVNYGTRLKLVLHTRQSVIHLIAGRNEDSRSLQNLRITFCLDRKWELAALQLCNGRLLKSYPQSVTWTVSPAEQGRMLESNTRKLINHLYWDGISSTPVATLGKTFITNQILDTSHTTESLRSALNLHPGNSVVVFQRNIYSELSRVLGPVNHPKRDDLNTFWSQIQAHPCIALRFIPQSEYQVEAPLSCPSHELIVTPLRLMLVYKAIDIDCFERWNSVSPFAATYFTEVASWDPFPQAKNRSQSFVFEFSWFETF